MRFKSFIIAALLCLQISLATAANVSIMPVKDLQPGMQGIGKTVIQGDTIEDFNVEIVGVSGTETSGYSILVRLYGDVIDRAGGVAHGMSGSPVYIDGRLVGAVAYGRSFDNPHYCFLTPIGSMLKMLDTPQRQPLDWIPQGTSLVAGGFTELGLQCLQDDLKAKNIDVILGVNNGMESNKPLEPGSSIGAAFMTGDMSLGATGTITWMDEQGHILAFGHPFMSRGDSNFFMNKSWVLGVIPNMNSAYKVCNIGSPIGVFEQDRSSGIAGILGKTPKSVPMVVKVSDLSRYATDTTRVRIIDDEKLLPSIVNATTVSCVQRTADRNGGGTAKVHFKVTGVDHDKKYLELNRANMYYATDNLEKNLTQEMVESLKVLMNNKFERLDLYGVDVDIEISDTAQIAELVKVSTKSRNVKPGEKIALNLQMRPYRGKEFSKIVEYTIPKTLPGGKVILNVHGGSSMSWIVNLLRKQKEEGVPSAKKEQKKQKSLKDFVEEVNTADRNNDVVIDISGGAQGMDYPKGDESLGSLLKGSPNKKVIPFDFIVDGELELVLNVVK